MQWARTQKGFTIVELLIVVVVIAILAAITIVSYNGISNRAKQSAVASDASQAQKKLLAYAALNNDQFPSNLTDAGITGTLAANLQYSVNNSTTPAGFCVTATQNGISSYIAANYQYTTSSGQTANQPNPTSGVCPGHSEASGANVTNLVLNPAVRNVPTNWGAVASTGATPGGTRVTLVSGLSSLGITTAYRNTLTGAASTWWRVQNESNITVTEGVTYTTSAYVRPSVAATTGAILIWRNAAGNVVSENGGTFTAQAAGSWAQRSVTAAAPAGAVAVRLQFGATNNGASGSYIDATAAMFYEGSTVYAYADGDSPAWIWEGASNASRSRGPATQ